MMMLHRVVGMAARRWQARKRQGARLPLAECGVLLLTAIIAWLSGQHPLLFGLWGPWDFSWTAFIGVAVTLLWFMRGLSRAPPGARMPRWRGVSFLAGMAALYFVLLTQFDYLAQHMFFLNRVQHLVMHHLAPFLIAMSWPGETIARGMPAALRRLAKAAAIRAGLRAVQQPVIALLLFEGLLMLWLVPPVTFRAMLDARLYAVMNASMVADGLLFWFLVLDPRPRPPAPIAFFTRLALAFLPIFPQIAIGTALGLAQHDLYPSFALCGRVFAAIDPLLDQQIGGLILWVPAGMMSALASVLIMRRMFHQDDRMSDLLAPVRTVKLSP